MELGALRAALERERIEFIPAGGQWPQDRLSDLRLGWLNVRLPENALQFGFGKMIRGALGWLTGTLRYARSATGQGTARRTRRGILTPHSQLASIASNANKFIDRYLVAARPA